MALTGLQIQKLLPKTNCKECGSNTCLAFAMKLAAKKAELALCPYASDEAKQVLGAASEPPVKAIALGADASVKLGEETVLYRHEKTFVNRTAFGVNIDDNSPTLDATLAAIRDYSMIRVGQTLTLDLVALTHKTSSPSTPAAFAALAAKAWKTTGKPLILKSGSGVSPLVSQAQSRDGSATIDAALIAAAVAVKGSRSLLCPAAAPSDQLIAAARENGHALAITAPDLDSLAALADSLKASGFADIVLNFQTHSLAEQFQTNSIARRAALKDSCKSLGYPSLHFITSADPLDASIEAITETNKYGGICIFPTFDPAQLSALLTLRLNIYTDPQKPIQVEPKVYPIGEPNADSPIFLTTNFSLTYFIVSGEIENSGTSAWLVVPECEGLSVLTAWAAGKFSGASIGKFIKEIGLEAQVTRRQLIIPGYVAQISGELEENLPGWKVVVGPQEAGDLESFVKARLGSA